MNSRTMRTHSTVRTVSRSVSGLCSDCGAPDANWASVNRGVLMCNDCASVHMGLGRHISQVKHLHKSHWHPNQLNMVQHLVNASANSIWEYSLLDPGQVRGGKRKPNPNDNVHPTKLEFIKSKYLNLAYVHRQPIREEEHHDYSKQLHSSVRTGNMDTSLRMLSLGAHADYFSTEKGNTPLHVAAKFGQHLQVELLVAYGADPGARDSNGKTAEDLARAENHSDLADRLVELQYEVSDGFTAYVCGETPDHKAGKHYLQPKFKDTATISSEGKKRLKGLNNQMFEVLAMDVYDEVDRRQLERIWQDVQKSVLVPGRGTNPALQVEVVPFLPLHPDYSSTRNQGRQKLAHFKESEINNLIVDIIREVIRREKIFEPIPPVVPEEDPIYDVPPDDEQEVADIKKIEPAIVEPEPPKEMVPKEEFLELQKQLSEKDAEILKLREQNRELSTKATVLARENHELSRKLAKLTEVAKSQHQTAFSIPIRSVPQSPIARPSSVHNPNDSSGSQSSLHSTGSHRHTIHVDAPNEEIQPICTQPVVQQVQKDVVKENADDNGSTSPAKEEPNATNSKAAEPAQNNSNANNNLPVTAPLALPESDLTTTDPAAIDSSDDAGGAQGQSNSSSPNSQVDTEEQVTWPVGLALKKKTDLLTKMIHSLLQTAQNKKVELYLECAENILSAVSDVVALFDKPHMPAVKSVLQQLCGSAHKLRNRCKENLEQKNKPENHKQLTEEIMAYAYEVAKAEKQLVLKAPKDDSETST